MKNYGSRVIGKLQMRGIFMLWGHKDWSGLVRTGYCQLSIILKLELTEDQTVVMVSHS